MNVIKTKIKDLLIIEPKVFGDDRGFFMKHSKRRDTKLPELLMILYRTIVHALLKVFSEVCISKKQNLKVN